MHRQLSVSAVSSWGWTFEEDLRFWSEARIGHVGLSWRKVELAGAEAAVRAITDAGLSVSDIVELGWWHLDDPSTWPAQRDRLLAAVEVASAVGGCLVLTTGPAGALDWDQAADALDAAVGPVRDAARSAGVVLTVEPTSALRLDLSFCTTVRDGVDLARALGLGLCVECNSAFAERGLTSTLAGATDVLAHVQVSDFVIGSLTTPDRAVPGDGDVPLGRLLGAIQGLGYTGAYELEMVGPRIESEGYASAITRGVDALDALLRSMPVGDRRPAQADGRPVAPTSDA